MPRKRQGLYDPALEHDACGVGFVVDLRGRRSHKLVRDGLRALCNLDHRGARGSEPNTGDGAGILIQIPHGFLEARCAAIGIDLPEPGQLRRRRHVLLPRVPSAAAPARRSSSRSSEKSACRCSAGGRW